MRFEAVVGQPPPPPPAPLLELELLDAPLLLLLEVEVDVELELDVEVPLLLDPLVLLDVVAPPAPLVVPLLVLPVVDEDVVTPLEPPAPVAPGPPPPPDSPLPDSSSLKPFAHPTAATTPNTNAMSAARCILAPPGCEPVTGPRSGLSGRAGGEVKRCRCAASGARRAATVAGPAHAGTDQARSPDSNRPGSPPDPATLSAIMRAWLALPALLLAACSASEPEAASPEPPSVADLALVPLPSSVTVGSGRFVLGTSTRLVASPGAESVAERLAAVLRPSTGLPLVIEGGAATSSDIALTLDELAMTGDEGYELEAGDAGISIRAARPAGLYYGCQTLRQLLPADVERGTPAAGVSWSVPAVTIRDAPRFAWRGAMLDVARHFFSVAEVGRFLDLVAYHKLNRLHLHLTDDQGWRVPIDSWPNLTAIGGSTEVGGGPGGAYTKADITELVSYAEARFVTLVPEVDMPGHVNAALASYGELDPSGQPAAPYTGTDVGWSSLWLEGPATAGFVEDVLGEVAQMFPGPYLHIGGDEAKVTPDADYASFVASLEPILAASGKTLVGWEEIGSADLAPPFLAQYWLSDAKALAAEARGAGVIASPAPPADLAMKYAGEAPVGQPYLGFTSVEEAYSWDPLFADLTDADVVGLEAPLWTETVATLADVELLAFPRLAGHAEIAWSPREGRSWDEYAARLALHGARLEALGVGYYRSPEIAWR